MHVSLKEQGLAPSQPASHDRDCIRVLTALFFVLFCLELAPMSPSQLSQLTDSPRVKSAVAHIAPPRRASDMTAHLPSLSASFVSSPTSIIERPTSIALPVPSVRRSTIILSPAPAGRRPTIQYPDPRCPIRSSQAAVPWPLVTSGSWSDRPLRHSDYEKRNTSSDTSEPTRA